MITFTLAVALIQYPVEVHSINQHQFPVLESSIHSSIPSISAQYTLYQYPLYPVSIPSINQYQYPVYQVLESGIASTEIKYTQ